MSRAALSVVVLMTRAWIGERPLNAEKDFVAFPAHPFWDSFCRWDSGWYDRIARLGYVAAEGQSDVAFFPAFPYLSRWLGPLLGGHFAAGLVIANLSLLGGLCFLYAMAEDPRATAEAHAGASDSRRAVWMVLVYPATVFFSAYYSEGLFFLGVAGSFYFYEKRRLLPAGAFGGLAAMTRGAGVLLFPALLLGALRRDGWRVRSARLLWLGLILLGLGVVMVDLAAEVGDPLAFVRVEAAWGRAPSLPLVTLVRGVRAFDPRELMDWLDLAATAGLLVVAVVAYRTLDLAHAVFALACVILPLCSGRMRGMERYAATVPALFLVLSMATSRPRFEKVAFLALGGLMAAQTALFVSWYWAG